jgi:hypothetical protein
VSPATRTRPTRTSSAARCSSPPGCVSPNLRIFLHDSATRTHHRLTIGQRLHLRPPTSTTRPTPMFALLSPAAFRTINLVRGVRRRTGRSRSLMRPRAPLPACARSADDFRSGPDHAYGAVGATRSRTSSIPSRPRSTSCMTPISMRTRSTAGSGSPCKRARRGAPYASFVRHIGRWLVAVQPRRAARAGFPPWPSQRDCFASLQVTITPLRTGRGKLDRLNYATVYAAHAVQPP